MFKEIRKADILLFAALILCATMLLLRSLLVQHDGRLAVITVDGKIFGSYPLDENRTIEIQNGDNKNVAIIQDGTVHMDSSTCHNQVCVDAGKVHTAGQSIICLPNRVVISIEGTSRTSKGEVDAIAR